MFAGAAVGVAAIDHDGLELAVLEGISGEIDAGGVDEVGGEDSGGAGGTVGDEDADVVALVFEATSRAAEAEALGEE